MKTEGLKVLHVSSDTLAKSGLKGILFRGGGVASIDHADTVVELKSLLKASDYDLLILDYSTKGDFGYQDITELRDVFPLSKVLVVSSDTNAPGIHLVLESGIGGCVTRACSEDEIIDAVFSTSKGDKFFCNKIIDIVLQKHLYNEADEDCSPTSLTRREAEVAGLVASGLTNREVADKLCLSTHTIHTHRKKIMKKLQLKSVAELTIYAINTGLFKPQNF